MQRPWGRDMFCVYKEHLGAVPVVKRGVKTRAHSKRWCHRDEKPLEESEQIEDGSDQHFNRIRLNAVLRTICKTNKQKQRDQLGYYSHPGKTWRWLELGLQQQWRSHSGCILKADRMGFNNPLDVGGKQKKKKMSGMTLTFLFWETGRVEVQFTEIIVGKTNFGKGSEVHFRHIKYENSHNLLVIK